MGGEFLLGALRGSMSVHAFFCSFLAGRRALLFTRIRSTFFLALGCVCRGDAIVELSWLIE
jgi:hypothetical protein